MVVELAAIAGASFVVAFSGALMPGPVLAVTLAGSRRHGFWFGPLVALGHGIVELPVVVLLAVGLLTVLDNVWVVGTIGYLGSAAMVWMAISMLLQTRHAEGESPEGDRVRIGATGSGVLATVANPYWYLWWVSVGAVLTAGAAAAGWLGIAVFFIGHVSADFVCCTAVSAGVTKGRRYLEGRVYKGLLVACAGILLVMAMRFLLLAVAKTTGFEIPLPWA